MQAKLIDRQNRVYAVIFDTEAEKLHVVLGKRDGSALGGHLLALIKID